MDCHQLTEAARSKLPHPEPNEPADGYQIRVATPYISPQAKANVVAAIDNNTISSGSPVVQEFESALKETFGVPSAIACSSGWAALVIALKLAKVGENDEVVIPTFTMVAVVNAVIAVGAKPVFIDSENLDKMNPSVDQYQQKITPSTKALIVAHTYGVPANCSTIRDLCDDHDIIMIEDIAEAIGVEVNGKMAGTYGDFACASLYANKLITAGDGGFVLSRHTDGIESNGKSYRNHGFSKGYHFVHYEHSGNYKMSGLQAAFVTPAVKDIQTVTQDRVRISNLYRKYLQPLDALQMMPKNSYGADSPWVFGVMAESKEKRKLIRQHLADNGIETRDYFYPLHLQPLVTERYGDSIGSFPVAEQLATCGFYLPTYFGLKEEDIQFICDTITSCLSV